MYMTIVENDYVCMKSEKYKVNNFYWFIAFSTYKSLLNI